MSSNTISERADYLVDSGASDAYAEAWLYGRFKSSVSITDCANEFRKAWIRKLTSQLEASQKVLLNMQLTDYDKLQQFAIDNHLGSLTVTNHEIIHRAKELR